MSTFDSTKRLLPEILAEIVKAKIQLPDFQRGWVWDDQHIRSLLVSIARSFPVGAVMLLETGGEAKFQVRPVEGVTLPPGASDAELLILDGQQRLTTLTQVLATRDAVKTRTEKGKPIRRHYYWNIEVALEGGDRLEDAIEAIEEDKIKRSNFGRQIDLDLTTTQKECEQLYFPCDQILNSDAWEEALLQARLTTNGDGTRANHGRKRPCACAKAKKLAPISREERAERRATGVVPARP